MGRPKRIMLATAAETEQPPALLGNNHVIARIRKAEGNNLYSVDIPREKEPLLVELPSRFRSQIYVRRGSFVVVDTAAFDERSNKLAGEIANVIRNEKQWRKQAYWPSEFVKKSAYPLDSDDEESTVGKMPPMESEDQP